MIFNLLLFILLGCVRSFEIDYEIEISDNILNITYFFVLSAMGLILVFLGTKLVKVTCFVLGFILLYTISWLIVNKLNYLNTNQFLALFIACHLLGLFGGLFCLFIPVVALFTSGFLLLSTLLNLILCLSGMNLIALGWVIIVSIGVLFGGVSIMYPNMMFPLSSSIIGCELFLIGIDLYIKTGLVKFIQGFYLQKFVIVQNSHALSGMLASIIPIGLIGFVFQYKLFKYEESTRSNRKATWSSLPRLPKLPKRSLTSSSNSPMIPKN